MIKKAARATNETARNLMALTRALATVALLPVVVVATAVHAGITALPQKLIGEKLKKNSVIPDLVYNTMRVIMGYKVVFNTAAAPLEKKKQTWYVANHWSIDDFIVLGSSLKGTFAGKGDILKWPLVAQLARAVKYIGLRRSKEFNPQSIAKLNKNFNEGNNAIMFPEATTTPGDKVYLFHAGLITLLFGEKGVDKQGNEVKLEKDVVVQPLAIRVKKVEGKDALNNPELRAKYCMYDEPGDLKRAWKRMKIRSMTIEVSPQPPLRPADFASTHDLSEAAGRSAAAKDLINAAAEAVVSVINPGQTTFEKAKIPGVPEKKKAPQQAA